MKLSKWSIATIIVAVVYFGTGMLLGYALFHAVDIPECDTSVRVDGVWLPDIKQLASYSGKYICINIDSVSDLNDLENVCKHESGHEIFARYCEKDYETCKEIIKKNA